MFTKIIHHNLTENSILIEFDLTVQEKTRLESTLENINKSYKNLQDKLNEAEANLSGRTNDLHEAQKEIEDLRN